MSWVRNTEEREIIFFLLRRTATSPNCPDLDLWLIVSTDPCTSHEFNFESCFADSLVPYHKSIHIISLDATIALNLSKSIRPNAALLPSSRLHGRLYSS